MQNLLARHKISSVIPDRIKSTPTAPNTISIEQQAGFENLRKNLFLQLKNKKLERVGIYDYTILRTVLFWYRKLTVRGGGSETAAAFYVSVNDSFMSPSLLY